MKILATSSDGHHQVIADSKAPARLWITRRDLHDWVWHKPIYVINEMFGGQVPVSRICRTYGIELPSPGIWNSLRAGKKIIRRECLDNSEASDPIPLAEFEMEGNNNTLRCSPDFLPERQLTGPEINDRDWPSEHAPSISCAIAPSKRLRISAPVKGPPLPLTRWLLRKFFRRSSYSDLRPDLQLYGISGRLFMKLLQHEKIAAFAPLKKWSRDSLIDIDCYNIHSNNHGSLLPLLTADRAKMVDLSDERRAVLRAEFEVEIAAAQAQKDEAKASVQAKTVARRAKLENEFEEIVRAWSRGVDLHDLLHDRGLEWAMFCSRIHQELTKCDDFELKADIIRIKRGLRGKIHFHPDDAVLMMQLLLPSTQETFKWWDLELRRYRGPSSAAQQRGLAHWSASAASAQRATIEDPLEECRRYLDARNGERMAPIIFSRIPQGLKAF